MKKLLALPVAALIAAFAFNAQAAEMTKAQIETIVHDYIAKNPEVLVESLQSYQSKQQDRDSQQFKDKIGEHRAFLTSSAQPYAGNAKGDVTVVEFFDYNCGYCKHAVDDVNKLIDQDKKVKIVFVDYPILSESSSDAARYALASQKQGKYFEFHQKLMRFAGPKNEEGFKSIATDLGLDFDKLKADADSKDVRDHIDKNVETAHALGIGGTPAFIFGDKLVPGYIDVDNMKQMVADTRKK